MSVCQTSGLLNTNTNLLISSLVSLICLLPVNPNSDAPKGLSLEHEPLDSIVVYRVYASDLKKMTLAYIVSHSSALVIERISDYPTIRTIYKTIFEASESDFL